ncbi:MAG: polysaccharide deacetylase family protein [Chthoniobacteraceae bacterium]
MIAPSSGIFGPVVTRFVTDKKELWLTIDDGPDGENSMALARELAQRQVRATFFVIGERLEKQPETARAMMTLGHTLANHTHTHPVATFWALLPWALRDEVVRGNERLARTGVQVGRWFRAPFGLKHVRLHSLLAGLEMRLVAWNIRGHDGLICDVEKVVERVVPQAHPGGIILLHEGRAKSNQTILRVVEELQNRGYSFVIPADDQLR